MKVTIERAALLKGLSHAQSVVERRNTIPILANIRLQTQDNNLALTATDMDLSIVEDVEVTVASAGATTAPAHMLYDIARKLPDGSQVELDSTAKEGQLILSGPVVRPLRLQHCRWRNSRSCLMGTTGTGSLLPHASFAR